MQRLRPGPQAPVSDQEFRECYAFPADRPTLRASFVMSLDGAVAGPDGSSRSIASASDRRMFSVLRMLGDVVLVGAGTLRDERYAPSRRTLAIVTRRLALSPDLPVFTERTDAHPRSLVLTTVEAANSAPAWLTDCADVVPCGDTEVDLRAAVGELTRRGLVRIHCEGGPALLGELVREGLIDELAISISPVIVGAEPSRHLLSRVGGLGDAVRWQVVHVLEEDGTVFLLLRRRA